MDSNEAIEIFKERIDGRDLAGTVSISTSQVLVGNIKEITGTQVFREHADSNCWLIFYNPKPTANYAHECVYYAVLNSGEILVNPDCLWYPHPDIHLKEVDINE